MCRSIRALFLFGVVACGNPTEFESAREFESEWARRGGLHVVRLEGYGCSKGPILFRLWEKG